MRDCQRGQVSHAVSQKGQVSHAISQKGQVSHAVSQKGQVSHAVSQKGQVKRAALLPHLVAGTLHCTKVPQRVQLPVNSPSSTSCSHNHQSTAHNHSAFGLNPVSAHCVSVSVALFLVTA